MLRLLKHSPNNNNNNNNYLQEYCIRPIGLGLIMFMPTNIGREFRLAFLSSAKKCCITYDSSRKKNETPVVVCKPSL